MWHLTNHACGRCFGRVLARLGESGEPVAHRCAECGNTHEGKIELTCACGVRVDARRKLQCFLNPKPTDEVPQEVLVREQIIERTVDVRMPIRAQAPGVFST